jgi:uncharacterized membrane protein (DUF2068 family)
MAEAKSSTIRIIAWFKLVKGALLICAASGFLVLLFEKGKAAEAQQFIQKLSVDPHGKLFKNVMIKFAKLSPKLPLVSIGTMLYGLIFCTEGIGLLMEKRWAEYLTAVVTGSFLPLEIYEIVQHQTILKGVLIGVNLGIFIYLIIRLKSGKQT